MLLNISASNLSNEFKETLTHTSLYSKYIGENNIIFNTLSFYFFLNYYV